MKQKFIEKLVPEAETKTPVGDGRPCSVDGIEAQVGVLGVETRILAGDGRPLSGAEPGAPGGGETPGPWVQGCSWTSGAGTWAQGCRGELGPVAEPWAQD